jgi:fatty acid desaturase
MSTRQAVANLNRIPGGVNVGLAITYGALNVVQYFILPACFLPRHVYWAWMLVPIALLNNSYWSLLHEAIHDLFYFDSRVNMIFGRGLSVMFGSPFRILRLSHLLHHKLNRTPKEGTEFYDRGKSSPFKAAAGYYFQIFGGLYLVELLSPLPFLLPCAWLRRLVARWVKPDTVSGILMQSWTRDEAIREIRIDGLLIFTGFATALYLYGAYWPLLVAILAARSLLISFLDNVYHYRTPVSDVFYAKNLWLPRWLATLLLNFNLHGIHHRHPTVPWRGLPLLFRDQAEIYQGNYFVAAADQLRGPVALQDLPWAG